jgi:hypothetical protein
MKYFLIAALMLSLTACGDATAPNPNQSVYAVDRTVREQYYNECIHENKNFDWLIQQGNLWDRVQSVCRRSAYERALFETTIGEVSKHPDWVQVYVD